MWGPRFGARVECWGWGGFRGFRGGNTKIHILSTFTNIYHRSPIRINHQDSALHTIIQLPLLTVIHHYSVFAIINLFVTIHHYSQLFSMIHQFTSIRHPRRCNMEKVLMITFTTLQHYSLVHQYLLLAIIVHLFASFTHVRHFHHSSTQFATVPKLFTCSNGSSLQLLFIIINRRSQFFIHLFATAYNFPSIHHYSPLLTVFIITRRCSQFSQLDRIRQLRSSSVCAFFRFPSVARLSFARRAFVPWAVFVMIVGTSSNSECGLRSKRARAIS